MYTHACYFLHGLRKGDLRKNMNGWNVKERPEGNFVCVADNITLGH